MQTVKITTESGYPTTIALANGRPRVCTTFGDDVDTVLSSELRSHYLGAVEAIDRTYGVWCDTESDSADLEDGDEVWYPHALDEQPTHWLTVGGNRVAVLPITDGCEPCELTNDCGLTTRSEWLSGVGADYSLRGGVLHCNGSVVVGEWSLAPIERE